MTGSIHIEPGQMAIVRGILQRNLPAGTLIWVFGSRVSGRAKPFSDLDLAVDAGRRLTLQESAGLSDAFSESDLPWKVDVVDLPAAADYFQKIVEAARVEFPMA